MKFKFQKNVIDTCSACINMVASHYKKDFILLEQNKYTKRLGSDLLIEINNISNKIGFKSVTTRLYIDDFEQEFLPCILYWNQNQFVVLYKISKNIFTRKIFYKIANPKSGLISISKEKFKKSWVYHEEKGIAIFLEPSEEFNKH